MRAGFVKISASIALCAAALFCALPAYPQDFISSDWVNQTQNSDTVGEERVQVETGTFMELYQPNGNGSASKSEAKHKPLKIRLGLFKDFEFLFEANDLTFDDFSSDTALNSSSVVDDIQFGFKYRFYEGKIKGFLPSTSLIFALAIPVGVAEFEEREAAAPLFLLAMNWRLPLDFDLAANFAVKYSTYKSTRNADGRYPAGFISAKVSRRLAPLTYRVSSFFELTGNMNKYSPEANDLTFGGGLSVLIIEDLQLDIVARSTVRDYPNFGGGLGFVSRY